MAKKLVVYLLLASSVLRSFAGDSAYGRVIEVRSVDVVVMEFGSSRFVVRLAGVVPPKEAKFAAQGQQFVEALVRGRGARMRTEGRNNDGEMVARVFVDDPQTIVKDAGVAVVLAGLACAGATSAYKYHELQDAQAIAKRERRGIWASAP